MMQGASYRRAFSMIELVATMSVIGIVSGIATLILLNASDGYLHARTINEVHADASVALDRIVRELRDIQRDESAADDAPDIDSLHASEITWGDDNTIFLSGSDLMLSRNGLAASVLLADVSTLTFEAFDEHSDPIALPIAGGACDPVRRLAITLTVTRNGASETLRTRVFLRSMINMETG